MSDQRKKTIIEIEASTQASLALVRALCTHKRELSAVIDDMQHAVETYEKKYLEMVTLIDSFRNRPPNELYERLGKIRDRLTAIRSLMPVHHEGLDN